MINTPSEKFNVCIVRLPGPVPFFEAYRECAETVKCGLEKLGHETSISDSHIFSGRTNIIFGFHKLNLNEQPHLPGSTIFYNMEQITPRHRIGKSLSRIKSEFTVWDYSQKNCDTLNKLGVRNVRHVPVGYVPQLTRISQQTPQDIDVLFYGLVNERRRKVLMGLKDTGLNVKVLQGIYGAERDRYIARAKVVLNMHLYPTKIFEIVRVSYLLANSKAVVSEFSKDTEIEEDLMDGVALADYEDLVPTCESLVKDYVQRSSYEQRGFRIMAARDESVFLHTALTTRTDMDRLT